MCRALQKQKLTIKKKTLRSSKARRTEPCVRQTLRQAKTERVQNLRSEYWQQVEQIVERKLSNH